MQNGKGVDAQPFGEHVRELRKRLVYVIATLFLSSSVGFVIHERIFRIIRRPLHAQLYYTTPTGGFNAIIKISILFGVTVTVPVIIYQLCRFLSPAFRQRLRVMPILLFSTILACMGVSFAYFISLPAALHFLSNIDSKDLQSIITVNEYLSFVTSYIAGFALLFQIPLIMLFINRIKPQKPGRLMGIQRYVVLISFILAAILTPTPDPVNQTIMALPIILLYQFSVGLIWFVNRREKQAAVAGEAAVPVVAEVPMVAAAIPMVEEVPLAYGESAYNAPLAAPIIAEPIPQAQPAELVPEIPVQQPIPRPLVERRHTQPQLIMDIFWAPQQTAT